MLSGLLGHIGDRGAYQKKETSDKTARHTIVTAIKNIACTAGQTTVRGGQRIRTAQFRAPVISRKLN